jgi:hypothetical protein
MWIGFLACLGEKLVGEGVLGYLGGGELETIDLGSGMGCTSRCLPTLTVLGAQLFGIFLYEWRA